MGISGTFHLLFGSLTQYWLLSNFIFFLSAKLLTARWINENTHLHYLQHFSFIFLDTPVLFPLIISFLRNSISRLASKDPNYREPGGGEEQKEVKCNYQILWWIAGRRYLETCSSSETCSKDSIEM